jgi:hypothetical protein
VISEGIEVVVVEDEDGAMRAGIEVVKVIEENTGTGEMTGLRNSVMTEAERDGDHARTTGEAEDLHLLQAEDVHRIMDQETPVMCHRTWTLTAAEENLEMDHFLEARQLLIPCHLGAMVEEEVVVVVEEEVIMVMTSDLQDGVGRRNLVGIVEPSHQLRLPHRSLLLDRHLPTLLPP